LHQEHTPSAAQKREAVANPVKPSLWAIKTLAMGQVTRCLDTQEEAFWQALPPTEKGGITRPAIVATVEFDGIKLAKIEIETLVWRYVRRVEYAVPVCIAPS
jgi:hypothetical protein